MSARRLLATLFLGSFAALVALGLTVGFYPFYFALFAFALAITIAILRGRITAVSVWLVAGGIAYALAWFVYFLLTFEGGD